MKLLWKSFLVWSCEPQILSSNPRETFVKSYWNMFLKVIFLPKNDFSFAFCTFISVICYFIFHHQTISSWFKKLYQVWWATLVDAMPNLLISESCCCELKWMIKWLDALKFFRPFLFLIGGSVTGQHLIEAIEEKS